MSKKYEPWTPGQSLLFPPSPMDWLPADHLVYLLLDVVAELDLKDIEKPIQQKDPRGTRPFNPRMMVALLLYGYCVGKTSSRKLERATCEDVAFRVLAGGQHPDHTVISEFRRVHLEALKGLFVQVLRLCQKAGLVKMGHVALDGTKLQANASKHKAMSYERMAKSEQELKAEIRKLMEEAERTDAEEDERHGKGKHGDELPEELTRRETRLKAIQRAKEALEAEAALTRAEELAKQAERAQQKAAEGGSKDKAEQRAAEAAQVAAKAEEKAASWQESAKREAEEARAQAQTRKEHCAAQAAEQAAAAANQHQERVQQSLRPESREAESPALPEHRVQADRDGNPQPSAQRNFTDPDSRIMKSGLGFMQGYNSQIAVSEGHQIILAQAVTNQAPDVEHLAPMLHQVEKNCGQKPETLTADAGYWSEANADLCEEKGVEAFIATGRERHSEQSVPAGEAPPPAPVDVREPMRQKLRTEKGRKAYSRRKAVVEPVFGQIKEARGIRRFLLRGLDKVRGEWSLICTGHNLLKLLKSMAEVSPVEPEPVAA